MTTAIDELFALLAEVGATVTLYGKPTTKEEVLAVAQKNVQHLFVNAATEVAVARAARDILGPPTHYWRVRTRLPERFGTPCWVTARGALNSCRVIFEDGHEVITSRNFVRKLKP